MPLESSLRPQTVRRITVLRHLVLSIALWLTYVLYWRVVLARGVQREAAIALGLLGLFVVLQVAFTEAWVQHNRRVSRRNEGRRCARPHASAQSDADFLGRRIEITPTPQTVREAQVVRVRVEEERKVFDAGTPPEARQQIP